MMNKSRSDRGNIGSKRYKTIIIAIIGALFFTLLGWYIRVYYSSVQPIKLSEVRENDPSYTYINPLLFVDSPRESPQYDSLKNTLSNYISSEQSNGDASSVSVYFQDLDSGQWTGVNEDEDYDPSSMLKVAMMVGYLKEAEVNPSILSKEIPYTATVDSGQNFKPANPLATGTYSAYDLIKAMIEDSDNDALEALGKNDSTGFENALTALDLNVPDQALTATTADFMSPKDFSHIFRSLFNATYLGNAGSQQALELLTQTNFDLGLVAQLPPNITVAHKFGEHTTIVGLQVQSHELHDCGIVYLPGHPYFICVMTKGQDFTKLESIISNISLMTYKNILQSVNASSSSAE